MASAYYFGGVAEEIKHHVSDVVRHENAAQKTGRIDDRVQLHLAPILVELRAINQRLERMEK
jgi:hypothetical protein